MDNPIIVDKKLAVKVGVNNAVILSYIRREGILSISDIISEISFLSPTTIERCVKKLIELGYIEKKAVQSPHYIKESLINYPRDNKYVCEWCRKPSITLQDHHFPIPKSKGGEEVVRICPNCHYGYHYMESNRYEGLIISYGEQK